MTSPKLCSYQTEGNEKLFASLFLALGLSVLVSGGTLIKDPLYAASLGGKEMMIGAASACYGLLALWSIGTRNLQLRRVIMFGTAIVWLGFAYFYLTGNLHKAGAVTCFVFAYWALWCNFHLGQKMVMQEYHQLISWKRETDKRLDKIDEAIREWGKNYGSPHALINLKLPLPAFAFPKPKQPLLALCRDGMWLTVQAITQ